MSPDLSPNGFFDLTGYQHARIFAGLEFAWEALNRIKPYLTSLLDGCGHRIEGTVMAGAVLGPGDIAIGPGTVVEPGAYITGPTVIGANCQIRHGAYVRGNAIIGDDCVVGNATEVKNSILLPGAHAPHFNYVGDSILGRGANLGAGTKLSNLTVVSAKDPVTGKRPSILLHVGGAVFDTGLAKLGAILGDGVQTGCNSVTNPGVLIGPHTLIYPNVALPKGYYPANAIIKLRQTLVTLERRR